MGWVVVDGQIGRDDGSIQLYGVSESVCAPIMGVNVGESVRGIAVGEVCVVSGMTTLCLGVLYPPM